MTINQLIRYLTNIKNLHGGNKHVNINITQLDTNLVEYAVREKTIDIYSLRMETGEKEFD